jgi:ABC-type oligopeptide transport system substrate-binding subunit
MRRLIFLAIVVFATLLVACNEQQHSVAMHDIETDAWSTSEEFTYINADSLSKRDISIVVRYGRGYTADSVGLRILAISPDSLVTAEEFTLRIPRIKEVRPEEQTFLYRKDVVLGRCGEYKFHITPDTLVEGISSVGIVIGEPEVK